MKTLFLIILGSCFLGAFVVGQTRMTSPLTEVAAPRARVIIDNDFGGDPDGLFQLVHHLLSPSVEIMGIIGSHGYEDGFYNAAGTAAYACEIVQELLRTMQLPKNPSVFTGAEYVLKDLSTPVISEGAEAIIREAMRKDVNSPLYIVSGGSLTDIASAWLMEPKIAQKVKLVWIGGPEYKSLGAIAPPNGQMMEYNLGLDLSAGQVIFNKSNIDLWQVPRSTYRQALVSYSELLLKVKPKGKTGAFLMKQIDRILRKSGRSMGEAYVLGDSPLVLLTALQSGWEADPSSSCYKILQAPEIDEYGQYLANPKGRPIRIYTHLDIRLMMADFYAKMNLFYLNIPLVDNDLNHK